MELMEALRTRRAVREFTHAPVEGPVIEALVAAAILAPSAMNLQPWAFAVVPGTARLRAFSDPIKQQVAAHLPADSPLAGHLADPRFEIFHGAPVLVVVCATDGGSQSAEDCCLAGESLMLAAHARGLGTCWIGLARPWLNLPAVKAELGIPAGLVPVAPIVVGHPQGRTAATARNDARIVWCR